MQKEQITVPRATLDFYKYEDDGLTFYEFNATECSPPEPMVNAIIGLELLQSENDRLIGIFFHEPTPLLGRIKDFYEYISKDLESGDVEMTFNRRAKL